MKVPNKNNDKKRKIKNKPIDKSKKQKVVVVAQEIKFARLLSGNEKKTRDRVLRALKKWLLSCFEKNYEFKEDDFTRVWKGLFYAVWMSDKPLVQEDLCESISGLLDLFPPEQLNGAMLLVRAGFKVLATEWFGIDHHRIDKFLMLVRRWLRGALRAVRRCGWGAGACARLADALANDDGIFALKTPVYARNATSMALHIADCYLEEISKVSSGKIPQDSLCELLRPFVAYLSRGADGPLAAAARRVVTDLIAHAAGDDEETESNDSGEETEAGDESKGDENGDGEDVGGSDDEQTEGPLDPRAGRVDVCLAALPVPRALPAALRAQLPLAAGRGQRRARRCLALLEEFLSGRDPFLPPPPPADDAPPIRPGRAARALRLLEKRLVADGDELALRGLSRKHRKRLLAARRAGLAIVDAAPAAAAARARTHANGEWQVEEAGERKNKKKRKQSNKENVAEPKNKRQKPNAPDVENKDIVKVSKKKRKNNEVKTNVKDVKDVKSAKDGKVKSVKLNGDVKTANVKQTKVKEVKISEVKETKGNEDKVTEVKPSKGNEVKITEVKPTTGNEVKITEVKPTKGNEIKVTEVKPTKGNQVKSEVKHPKPKVKVDNFKESKPQKATETKAKEQTKASKPEAVTVRKIKKFEKQDRANSSLSELATPKKVKFVLKNNCMQGALDYYKSVRRSPSIPFDSSKVPSKTNLKVNTPSPINPFFKKKMTRRASLANITF